jgi:hypothetical protein
MRIFGWWGTLSPLWRYGIAIILLAISTVLFFLGRLWIWGWVIGAVLLMFAGPSESERKGYRF